MSLALNPYSAYKNSGVEWLRMIPNHWSVKPFKSLFSVIYRYPTYYSIDYENDGVKEIRGEAIGQDGKIIKLESERYISPITNRRFTQTILLEGDLVMSVRGTMGKVGYVDERYAGANITANLLRLSPKRDIVDGHYLRISLASNFFQSLLDYQAPRTTIKTITIPQLSVIPFFLPPLPEQHSIVRYLDHKTAAIDALIAKKERLIELLEEKRAALITQAVTKGLDPTVPMNDSGVEWLGEIPEHWERNKIKQLFRQAKRQNYPDLTVLSVYRDYGVIEKSSRDDNINRTPDNLQPYQLVNEGDLVINKMKAWQGSLGISNFRGITSPDYVVYTPDHNENDKYLHLLLRSQTLADVYRSISNGIRPDQWRLVPEKFEQLIFFMPPPNEQSQIGSSVTSQAKHIENMIDVSCTAISLLGEYRTALISAAVTGKIVVREGVQ